MVKAIIFDCWGTLFYNELNPQPFSLFAKKIGKDFHDYDYMTTFEKHFMLKKHLDFRVPIKSLLRELNLNPSIELIKELKSILDSGLNHFKPYPETLEVLGELKKRYKLCLISNTGYLAFNQLKEHFNLDEIFDIMLPSYKTGILKPNPKIFELMIKKLKIDKNDALMIGDSLKQDIQAAENFGIKGILIDRKEKHPDYPSRITSLKELQELSF